jgi:hypothetical protein
VRKLPIRTANTTFAEDRGVDIVYSTARGKNQATRFKD